MARPRSYYGLLIATVTVALVLLFAYSVAKILLLVFIAVLFALFLGAATDYLERRLRLPRWAGLPIALVLAMLALTAIALLIIPPVLAQTHELISVMPALLAQWEARLFSLVAEYPLLEQMLPPRVTTPGGYFDAALERAGRYVAGFFPLVFSGLHFVIDFVAVVVMGIYLALRPGLYRGGVIALVPRRHRTTAAEILAEVGVTLRGWIVGQMLAMVFLGVLTWIGLVMLDVPYALAFGVFTGVAVMVPFFGTLVSTVLPALFVLGSDGLLHALMVILLGVVIHLVEANVVHPLIMERQVNVPPVLSILGVLIMAELLGAIGLVVAVPVLATGMVLVRRIYVQGVADREESYQLSAISYQSSVPPAPGGTGTDR